MEQQPQQQYLNDIPSLHQTFPDLPNVLGGIDLNIAIQAGAPINPEFRRNAKSVTAIVKDMHAAGFNLNEALTPEVVEAAELREIAVNNAHSTAMYMPGNLVQELAQVSQQLGQINNQLAQLNGNCENLRIAAWNRHHALPVQFQPLLKTVPGHGLEHANAIYAGVNGLQHHLVAPEQDPQLGTVPPNFRALFPSSTEADIIRLIIFYNNNFGIVQGETVQTSVQKIGAFLMAY